MKRLLAAFASLLLLTGVAFAQAQSGGNAPVPNNPPVVIDAAPGLAPPASMRQVVSRTLFPTQHSGTLTQTWRAKQTAYVNISAIQYCEANSYYSSGTAAEIVGGSTRTKHRWIEYPLGTWTQLTFSGSTTGTDASGVVGCSDYVALGFTIPAFAQYRIVGDDTWAAGGGALTVGFSNVCDKTGNMPDEYQVGIASGANSDTPLTNVNGAQCYLPQAALAISDRAVWGIVGDSLALGTNDYGGDPTGTHGLYARALAQLGPVCDYGSNGDQAVEFAVTTNAIARLQLLTLCNPTAILDTYGVNDIFTAAQTPDQIVTSQATIVTNLKAVVSGVKVYDTTITPKTQSSDGWNTTANQSQSATTADNNRKRYNDFKRGVAANGTISNAGTWTAASCVMNGTTTVTSCAGLIATNVSTGMAVTGTSIAANTTVSAVNLITGAITLNQNASGSSTSTLTFVWPAMTSTWPTTFNGTVDTARVLEGATYAAAGPYVNGGVWLPGLTDDGLHGKTAANVALGPLFQSLAATQR